MNRMVDPESLEWAQWVLLLALGGIGSFVFSLAVHAGGEWVLQSPGMGAVVASAMAVGFLAVPLFMRVSRQYVDLCVAILLLEAGVGLRGFVLHAAGNLRGPSIHAFDNIYGAPPKAPLFFPNLMVLGVIALAPSNQPGADLPLRKSA